MRSWAAMAATSALSLALTMTCAATAWSQEVRPPLRLEQVLEGVDTAHPKLRSSRAKVRKARAKIDASRGAFDTTLNGGVSYASTKGKRYGLLDLTLSQPTTFYGVIFFTGYRADVGKVPVYKDEYKQKVGKSLVYKDEYQVGVPGQLHVGLLVPLWRGGRVDKERAKLAQSEADLRASAALLELTRLELELEATIAYLKWVASGLKVEALERQLELATRRSAQVSERVKRGELAPIEELDNRRAVLKREGKLLDARSDLNAAAAKLSYYLRDARGAPRAPRPDELPTAFAAYAFPAEDEVEQLARDAGKRRPEWRALAAERRALEMERRLANNQAAPKVDLTASLGNELAGIDPEANIGVKMEVQLQRRGARGTAGAAEAEIARIDAERDILLDKQRANVLAAFAELDAAHRATFIAREELSISKAGEDAEKTKFELGDSTLLKVNLREQYTIDAATRYIEAQRAARAALATFCVATGRRVTECLGEPGVIEESPE